VAIHTVVSLTFDNGAISQYTLGYQQALQPQGVKATFYLNTGVIGGANHLTWSQLAALQSAGQELGGKTVDGTNLTTLTASQQVAEICNDRQALISHGLNPVGFAYPAGAFNATALGEPLWWPALTRYVAEMQAAWLAFASTGRQSYPRLSIVFSMLAGLAPLHAERLCARGGPAVRLADPLTFYDSSSYGQAALATLAPLVGEGQILFGSDRPVVVAPDGWLADGPDWNLLAQNTRRALGRSRGVEAAGARTVAAARISWSNTSQAFAAT